MRQDLERIHKHEETRQPRDVEKALQTESVAPTPIAEVQETPDEPLSLAERFRILLDHVFGPASAESTPNTTPPVPEHLVTLLLAIQEVPAFAHKVLLLESLPPERRHRELQKIAALMRANGEPASLCDGLEQLQDEKMFQAFCQALREELE